MYALSRSNLYNVIIQIVKFLLVAIALYQFNLATQLSATLPATLVLVNATPESQNSRDRSFNVTFYGLHFFANYTRVNAHVSLIVKGKDRDGNVTERAVELEPESPMQKKGGIPFYSAPFRLPDTLPPGTYDFRYKVGFDNRIREPGKDRSFRLTYAPDPQQCHCIGGGPLTVRLGQRVALPIEWNLMELQPLGNQAAIEARNGKKWLAAKPALGEGSRTLSFRSLLVVTDVDQTKRFIKTHEERVDPITKLVTITNGPTIYWDPNTLICSMGKDGKGTQTDSHQILSKYRIAFAANQISGQWVASQITVAPTGVQSADVSLNLIALPNMPPRSAYDDDGRDEVSLYTSWLFSDGQKRYFNLNRYIIDPDGQNDNTFEPDIHVKHITMDNYDDLELKGPPEVPEFRLYLKFSLNRFLAGFPEGGGRYVRVTVWDEGNTARPLRLGIYRL